MYTYPLPLMVKNRKQLYASYSLLDLANFFTIISFQAGVRATLNAKTSILAAANPIGGRYDRGKSLQQNVALSAPIMSRFDLFFVLIDESNPIVDHTIAQKIVALHQNAEEAPRMYTQEEILRYITFARQFKPRISLVSDFIPLLKIYWDCIIILVN